MARVLEIRMSDKKRDKQVENDTPDLTEIYEEHYEPLKGYISKHTSYSSDSEDLLHDVFYQLSRIDFDKNPIERITAWLYRVAENKIIDRSRKKREESMPQIVSEEGEDTLLTDLTEFLSDPGDSPEIQMLHSLVWDELDMALEELPEEQRQAYELHEFEGFSFNEISEATGVPVNTLISRKRYAVLHLRERLQELYEAIVRSE